MSRRLAFRIEMGIIGLGVVALLMIFQPFSLAVFSVGCGLVVLAALLNNALPMAEPGRPLQGVLFTIAVVGFIFCAALLVAIAAAHGYGLLFLAPPAAATPAPPAAPFWAQPFVHWVAGFAVVFGVLVGLVAREGRRT